MKHWYAIQVSPKKERFVADALHAKGLEFFLPCYTVNRRWSDRVRRMELPLFPGYVFCQIPTDDRSPRIVSTPGVRRLVSFGGQPAALPESDLAAIRQLMTSGRHIIPWPYLRPGEQVRIENGPLCGLEGRIEKIQDQSKLIVSVHFLQRSLAVEMAREDVTPLSAARSAAAGGY